MDIRETYNALREIENLKVSIKKVDSEIYKVKNQSFYKVQNFIFNIFKLFMILFFGMFVYFTYGLIGKDEVSSKVIAVILAIIATPLVYLVMLLMVKILLPIFKPILRLIKLSEDSIKSIDKLCTDKEELSKKIDDLNVSLQKSVVPRNYRGLDAMQFIMTALNDKRADNITDLINLYEEHLDSKKKENLLREIRDENQKMNRQLSGINREARRIRRKI